MSIQSIRVKNLLSFDDFFILDIKDVNCIIGENNVGKSNLLKIIEYFYSKMSNESIVTPSLYSRSSSTGSVSITFDITRLRAVVFSGKAKSDYQKHILSTLFKSEIDDWKRLTKKSTSQKGKALYKLTLTINKDDSVYWSEKDHRIRDILSRIFPFFSIDTRQIDLYDWSRLWNTVSKLKFLNTKQINRDEVVEFFDSKLSSKSNSYKSYIDSIGEITKTSAYSYQELILSYIKVGLEGHTFNIEGKDLDSQSDGTNSHKFIEIFLNLMIALTRREFITPTVFIDEPEIGLHPKRNEQLIENLHKTYRSYKKTANFKEAGKYATPNPKIIFATHSPNIVKTVIKLFSNRDEHQILHFSKKSISGTHVSIMNSHFSDPRFLNVFSDNEARLFFSKFILFVEGETEIEIFGNLKLNNHFKKFNKVDVYRTNEVMLKAINPSISNLSIPYLILYDADKMMTVDHSTGALVFKKSEVNLFDLKKKYSKTFFGSKSHYIKRGLSQILLHHERAKTLVPSKIDFEIFKYPDFMSKVNEITLKSCNTFIVSSTIEGSLINKNSIHILYKWMIHEFIYNLRVGGKGDTEKRIAGLKLGNMRNDICRLFSALYAKPIFTGVLCPEDKKFTDFTKIKYLKHLRNRLSESSFTENEMVIVFRLVFEGKTNTLVSKDNNGYENISDDIKNLVIEIRDNCLNTFPIPITKTGGWVTSFINFSIDYIEKTEEKKSSRFKAEFQKVFPELYDILSKVEILIE